MGKLGNFLVFTAFLATLVGIRMVAVQGQGTLYTSKIDLSHIARTNKIQIDKLRESVKGDVTHEYMLGDGFLVKWLLEKNFDIMQAAEMLKKNLEWRAAQNMNSILEENWKDMHSNFPYSRNTTDKFGRPLLFFDFGQWNIAKFISEQESGKERLERYFYKFLEESEQHVRDLQAQGQDVIQYTLIVDMEGFSLEKHGCIQCLHFYRSLGQTLALNFPWATERVVFVNSPYIFDMAYAYLIDQNKKSINVLGREKPIWKKTLLETIDQNQFPRGLLEQQTHFI